MTFAWWEKLSARSGGQSYHYTAGTSAGGTDYPEQGILSVPTNGLFETYSYNGSYQWQVQTATSERPRDPSAWIHRVAAIDTNATVASDRIKLYTNGVLHTTFAVASYPAQFFDLRFQTTGVVHYIGTLAQQTSLSIEDRLIAEFHVVVGQALPPTAFGEFSSIHGQWVPKRYTGAYGVGGFYLPFNNAASTTTIGQDRSGNANDWTATNISVTAGTTFDQMTDTPTNNYATANPLFRHPGTSYIPAFSDANLTTTHSAAGVSGTITTIPVTTGKWWFKLSPVITNAVSHRFGIVASNTPEIANLAAEYDPGQFNYGCSYRSDGTRVFNNVNTGSWGATWTTGDEMTVAFDADTGKVWFQKNGVWQGNGDPGSGTNPAVTLPTGVPFHVWWAGANGISYSINPGSRPFTYAPPTGFLALCTNNLPTPAVLNPATQFNAVLWSGTGGSANTSRSITGMGFQPDLIIGKVRNSSGAGWLWHDNFRGVGTGKALQSNSTSPEGTTLLSEALYGYLSSIDGNGFTVTNGSSTFDNWNKNGDNYVAYGFKKGVTPGFDIVTYPGSGANRTINHSLGATPHMYIVRNRTNNGRQWAVYHRNANASPASGEILLHDNTAGFISDGTMWNSTVPTSSVFSVGTNVNANESAANFVAYLWTSIPGFSQFGTYTGNANADGPFVWCGFKPRFLLVRNTGASAGDWMLTDAVRSPFNGGSFKLYPNSVNIENGNASESTTTNLIDFVANGFKVRSSNGNTNASGESFIFMAFAEAPSKFATGR
jgi:hypothetical protein